MKSLLEAMATEEGFYLSGSRPARNNNPLDLTYCDESIHFGATGTDGRFAIFPSIHIGFSAGARWLSVTAHFDAAGNLIGGYLGATLKQVIYRFAPPSDNNSVRYLENVCEMTGYSPSTVLTSEMLAIPQL
jgi:hypothetical protein